MYVFSTYDLLIGNWKRIEIHSKNTEMGFSFLQKMSNKKSAWWYDFRSIPHLFHDISSQNQVDRYLFSRVNVFQYGNRTVTIERNFLWGLVTLDAIIVFQNL